MDILKNLADYFDLDKKPDKQARKRFSRLYALIISILLIVFAICSLPTFKEAFLAARTGVSFGEATQAVAQSELWSENVDCMTTTVPQYVDVPKDSGVSAVSILVCPSGDVLVTANPDTPQAIAKWISHSDFQVE